MVMAVDCSVAPCAIHVSAKRRILMLLSDRDILAAQKDGHISLDPWTPEMVQPASIEIGRAHV